MSSGISGIGLALLTDVCLAGVLPPTLGTELRISSIGLISLPVSVEVRVPVRLDGSPAVGELGKGGRSSSPSPSLPESGDGAPSLVALLLAALRAFAAAFSASGSG
jgi:hypothetical protein